MAEQNETKKKSPLIPPNFRTLAKLKEEKQERDRREREEQEKQERERREREEREREEREREEEEKENQSVRRREKGKPVNRRIGKSRGGDDRRYRRKETEELEVAMVCMVTVSENVVEEVENEGFKSGSKIWKRKEKGGNQLARADNEAIGGEGKATLVSRKPDELEVAAAYVVTTSENAVEEGRERVEKVRKGYNSGKKKGDRKDKARADDEEVIGGEELVLPSQNVDTETVPAKREPRPKRTPKHLRSKIEDESEGQLVEISEKIGALSMSGKNIRKNRVSRDEEVIGGEEILLPSQGVDKETVPARRESRRGGKPRHFKARLEDESEGQWVEISEKFGRGGSRREDRFPRRYSTRSNSTYGRGHGRVRDLRHPREMRDSGMVWVKKGDVADGNAGEVQQSELLSKGLD